MSPPPRRRWRRTLPSIDDIPELPYLAAVGVLVVLTWLFTSRLGAEMTVWNHLFYVPIVLAGMRFGGLAGSIVGLVSGLLAGPISGHLEPSVVLPRTALFVLVGAVVGVLAAARTRSLQREREVAERESALVAQRASLVQLVSHEFRTPLTIIRGCFETLSGRQGAVASPFHELLQATERSVDRLQEMVDVVLAAADELDTGATPQVPVDLGQLVDHAARSLGSEVPGRLRLDIPANTIVVTVEPYLWLAVRCLLDNAAKFSPAEERVHVLFVQRTRGVEISVTDRGPGLPDGFERFAFEPFTQGDSSVSRTHPGLGMGLYTARRLVRRVGGDVTVASGQGRGTTATIVLPQRRQGDAEGTARYGDYAHQSPLLDRDDEPDRLSRLTGNGGRR